MKTFDISKTGGIKGEATSTKEVKFDEKFIDHRATQQVTTKSVNTLILKHKTKDAKSEEFQAQFHEKVQESMVYWPRGWVSKELNENRRSQFFSQKQSMIDSRMFFRQTKVEQSQQNNIFSSQKQQKFDAVRDTTKGNLLVEEPTLQMKGEKTEVFPQPDQSRDTLQLKTEKTEIFNQPNQTRNTLRTPEKRKYDCMIGDIYSRTRHANPGIRLACCVTQYNEGPNLFKRTLKGLISNYHQLMDPVYGNRFGWDDIVIFQIIDGYDKLPEINSGDGETESFQDYATKREFFDIRYLKDYEYVKSVDPENPQKMKMKTIAELQQDNLIPKNFQGGDYTQNLIHIFQKKIKVKDLEISGLHSEVQNSEINFMFAVKQCNDKKINSHKWFFNGLCQLLNPQYTLVLDVGTEIGKGSLAKLINYMDRHPRCGGCTGEIAVETSLKNFNPVELAQFYEYKVGHAPDKYFENFFKFNSVLPGAYSVFRFDAIIGSPIREFYKGLDKLNHDCPEANKYLAEDRIMCFEICNRSDRNYYLTYVPDAPAYTDAPNSLIGLMKQRRRWNNGSLFGSFHFIQNIYRHIACRSYTDKQNTMDVLFMLLQRFLYTIFSLYYTINIVLGMSGIGFFAGITSVMIKVQFKKYESLSGSQDLAMYTFLAIYLAYVAAMCFISLKKNLKGLKQKGTEVFFYFIVVVLAFMMIIFYFLIILYLIDTNPFTQFKDGIDWSTGQLITLAIIGILINFVYPIILNPIRAIKQADIYFFGLIIYLLSTAAMMNLLGIYSVCNIDDISWGNRPDKPREEMTEHELKEEDLTQSYVRYKWKFLIGYLTWNLTVCLLIVVPYAASDIDTIDGCGLFLSCFIIIKLVIALLWYIGYYIKNSYAYVKLGCQKMLKCILRLGCCKCLQVALESRNKEKREELKEEKLTDKLIVQNKIEN